MKNALKKSYLFLVSILLAANFAQANSRLTLEQAIAEIALEIDQKSPSGQTILIRDLKDMDGRVSHFGRYLPEQIHIQLANKTNRKVLMKNKVIDEIGLMDSEAAIQYGKALGAETVVYGTVTEFRWDVAVNLKIVNIEDGMLLAGVSRNFKKNRRVRSLLAKKEEPKVMSMDEKKKLMRQQLFEVKMENAIRDRIWKKMKDGQPSQEARSKEEIRSIEEVWKDVEQSVYKENSF